MPTMRLWPGFRLGLHWGSLQRCPGPLTGNGGGAPRDGPHPEGGTPGKRRGEEEKGWGRGKIVATRCQILRLKCEDALYKYTD